MVSLRSALPEDRGAVERLLERAGLPLEGVAENFAAFIVAENGREIVGAIGLEDYRDFGLLRSAVVDPAYQGTGLGQALAARLLGEAQARRHRAVYLLTTTAADYFPRFGFRPIARDEVPAVVRESAEFQGACPASATVMEARLA